MKNKAINALIEMGMSAKLKGFQYIVDAMCLFENASIRTGNISTLYLSIAEMHKVTRISVERDIRNAFRVVITKGYLEAVKKYLTMQNPTSGNLLNVLYLRLSQED